jgi:hypothetical protein
VTALSTRKTSRKRPCSQLVNTPPVALLSPNAELSKTRRFQPLHISNGFIFYGPTYALTFSPRSRVLSACFA